MEMHDQEERYAKCNICNKSLDIIENILYGNRCVFCYQGRGFLPHKEIGLLSFLTRCYYSWLIYQETKKLIYETAVCPKCLGTKKIHNSLYEIRQQQIADQVPVTLNEDEVLSPCPECSGKGIIHTGRTFFDACLGQAGGGGINQLTIKQRKILLRELKKCRL